MAFVLIGRIAPDVHKIQVGGNRHFSISIISAVGGNLDPNRSSTWQRKKEASNSLTILSKQDYDVVTILNSIMLFLRYIAAKSVHCPESQLYKPGVNEVCTHTPKNLHTIVVSCRSILLLSLCT
jgi:hypothetical protein